MTINDQTIFGKLCRQTAAHADFAFPQHSLFLLLVASAPSCILLYPTGVQSQLAMVATVWPCSGPCQLQPTSFWWRSCATISSYGASSHPNYCTNPCTSCWPQQSVSSSSRWSKATARVSPKDPKTYDTETSCLYVCKNKACLSKTCLVMLFWKKGTYLKWNLRCRGL